MEVSRKRAKRQPGRLSPWEGARQKQAMFRALLGARVTAGARRNSTLGILDLVVAEQHAAWIRQMEHALIHGSHPEQC